MAVLVTASPAAPLLVVALFPAMMFGLLCAPAEEPRQSGVGTINCSSARWPVAVNGPAGCEAAPDWSTVSTV